VISFIRGRLAQKRQSSIVIDVGGIGYEVFVDENTLHGLHIGEEVTLQTAQVIREDSQTLYGFITDQDLGLFHLLCSVSGVGPKMALVILSSLGVNGVQKAVAEADDQLFKSVSGVGPKTAKLIILALTGKLITSDTHAYQPIQQNVIKALIGLGYSERVAKETVAGIEVKSDDEALLLKSALAKLSKAKGLN
jgi:holliday junction DNA helicase RuvA